jgi:hypothetical protein
MRRAVLIVLLLLLATALYRVWAPWAQGMLGQ